MAKPAELRTAGLIARNDCANVTRPYRFAPGTQSTSPLALWLR